MSSRRELTREPSSAVGLCLLGAVLLLIAVGRTWVQVSAPATSLLPARDLAVPGRAVAPGLTALAVVALAGVVALAATRAWGRVAVGVLLLLDGAVALGLVVERLGSLGRRALEADVVRESGVVSAGAVTSTTPWPYLAGIAGLLVALAGLLVSWRGPRWAALGRRYDAPVPAPEEPVAHEASDREVWEALDRGEDPTHR